MERLARDAPDLGRAARCRPRALGAGARRRGVGAAIFSWVVDPGRIAWAGGYAAIEVLSAIAGAWAAHQIASIPLKLERPREVAALVVGAVGDRARRRRARRRVDGRVRQRERFVTFYVWSLAEFRRRAARRPVIVTWAGFRAKRSGGLTMPQFIGGRGRVRAVPRVAAAPVRRQHDGADERLGRHVAHVSADPLHRR